MSPACAKSTTGRTHGPSQGIIKQMDETETQLRDEVSRIVAVLEGLTGRRSRWTGVVELSDDITIRGKISWKGDIAINRGLAATDLRWRTEIHEALHTFSEGLTPSHYFDLIGWEEGTVEQLQRLLRPVILAEVGAPVPEPIFLAVEQSHEYNRYIAALEGLRETLGHAAPDFYLRLLETPLGQRPMIAIQAGQKRQGEPFKNFQRAFAASFTVLRGE